MAQPPLPSSALSVPLSEGEVLQPTHTPGTYDYRGTAYVGNVEYAISKTFINQYGGYYIDKYTLSKVYNTEGYTDGTIIPDETNYRYGIRYNYYRRDHLGNNREVWATEQVNYGGTIPAFTSQRTQYYPVLRSVSISGYNVRRSLQTTSELKSGLCLEN